jgi:phage terminase small subunit
MPAMAEPAAATVSEPSAELGAVAQREWIKVAQAPHERCALTAIDREPLAAYCRCWTTAEKALAAMAKLDR